MVAIISTIYDYYQQVSRKYSSEEGRRRGSQAENYTGKHMEVICARRGRVTRTEGTGSPKPQGGEMHFLWTSAGLGQGEAKRLWVHE